MGAYGWFAWGFTIGSWLFAWFLGVLWLTWPLFAVGTICLVMSAVRQLHTPDHRDR